MRRVRTPLRVFTLAVLLVPVCAGRAGTAAAAWGLAPDLVERVKRAVVVVSSYDEGGHTVAQGSGFFVRPGEVVTNLHVVGRAARVEVLTFGGRTCEVTGVAAFDAGRDLALLRVGDDDAEDVSTLEVEASAPRAGEDVFVVSNPRGSFWQVSEGTALAPREFPEIGRLLPFTAQVSRGSSGGPVVNLRGRVVGVATMSLQKSSVEEYFALPGEEVLRLRPGAPRPFPLRPSD